MKTPLGSSSRLHIPESTHNKFNNNVFAAMMEGWRVVEHLGLINGTLEKRREKGSGAPWKLIGPTSRSPEKPISVFQGNEILVSRSMGVDHLRSPRASGQKFHSPCNHTVAIVLCRWEIIHHEESIISVVEFL